MKLLKAFENAKPDEVYNVVHRLSGIAGMFGFFALGAAAERLENAIRDGDVIDDLVDELVAHIEQVQAL